MKKLPSTPLRTCALLLLGIVSLACQTTKLPVKADTPARLAQLPRTPIDYDRSLLNENERQVVARLIEASKHIDEIFWLQVSEQNPEWRKHLAAQADASAKRVARLRESPGRIDDIPALQVSEENAEFRSELAARTNAAALDRAGYDYFLANKGPWDRLAEDEPFVGKVKKPAGAAFYPADLTKEEFESYIAAHPDQKEALQSLFTVVRRQGDRLVAIPYSVHYRAHLEPAAARLREAAELTKDMRLRDYLTRLADAFFKDNYRESDMAWMDLQGPLEVVIGPYEVYEDALFNYKAAFESFITVVDKPETEKLAVYAQHLPAMERNLPEPDQYKNPNRGTESPIRVVQEIYTAGDARRGVQTAAFNLPNDEVVREQKGSKKVLLKNVMDAKYRISGQPIALRVLDASQRDFLNFDAYFNHVLFHELSHGLGPGLITQPNGERVDVRFLLKDTYSAMEECKADVLGEWNMLYARENGLLSTFTEQQQWATYAGLMFRSMRFGIDEAHGRGTAVQWNWLRERGAIASAGNDSFTVDFAKMRDGVRELTTEILVTQATGDYARAQRLLTKYGVSNREIESVIAKMKDIPVDLTPVFPAAGEN